MFSYTDIMIARTEANVRHPELASLEFKKVQDAIARADADNWQRERMHGPLVLEMQPDIFQSAFQALVVLFTRKSANRVRAQQTTYLGHGVVTK
jgi:hypothetical protein